MIKLNNTPDAQERYSKSTTHLDRKVPLASDASNLLSDYLDTICIQFARNNVAEPYSITSEYEEMILTELSELSTGHKLTIDIIVKIIERIGDPKKVVMNYIKENNPTQVKIFEDPSVNAQRIKGIDRKITARREGDVKDTLIILAGITGYLLVFVFLFNFAFQAMFIYKYFDNPNPIYIFQSLITANIIYSLLEIISAVSGETFIGVKSAKYIRSLFFKLQIFFINIVYIIYIRRIIVYNARIGDLKIAITVICIALIITQLRDYFPFLYPLNPSGNLQDVFSIKNALIIIGWLIFNFGFLYINHSTAFPLIGVIISGIGIAMQTKKLKWTSWHALVIYLFIYGSLEYISVYLWIF